MTQSCGHLLSTGQVAEIFAVDPATVTRWADRGKLPSIRTPGGHRRFKRSDVDALINPDSSKAAS